MEGLTIPFIIIINTFPGTTAAVCITRARRSEDATGSGFHRSGSVQEDLHESTRERQVRNKTKTLFITDASKQAFDKAR